MRPQPDDLVLLHLEPDALGVVLRVLPGQRLVGGPEDRVLEEVPALHAAAADALVLLVAHHYVLEEALRGNAHQLRL